MKEKLITLLMVSVMVASAFGAMGLSATKVGATGESLTLSSSNYAPSAGQQYILSGRLTDSAGKGLAGKSIDIFYHFEGKGWQFSNSVPTGPDGKYSTTTSSTQKVYLQTGYKVNGVYVASSNVVTVNVGTTPTKTATTTTITASKTTPIILEQVTFTVQLTRSDTKAALANKPVTIWHYSNGVRYDDIKDKQTDGSGKVAILESFSTAGVRTYYASFAGDSQYATSQSGAVKIYVSTPTTLTIRANKQDVNTGQGFTVSGTLTTGTTPLANQQVTVVAYGLNTKQWLSFGSAKTNSNGAYSLLASIPNIDAYVFYASFSGSPTGTPPLSASQGGDMLVQGPYITMPGLPPPPSPTDLTIITYPTQTPKVNSKLTIGGYLYSGANKLVNKPVVLGWIYRASPSQPWSSWTFGDTTNTRVYPDPGSFGFDKQLNQKGWYVFQILFNGDSSYHNSASNRVEVVVT